MAAIASFSVARENGQCQQKIQSQVAAILIIGGELKILSGDLHTHG